MQDDLPPNFIPYVNMTDWQVAHRAQRDDEVACEYLLYKYRNLVSDFLVGAQNAEKEDLLEVGIIGLWQAIVDYRCDQDTSFLAFAGVCIHRHIVTAIQVAYRCRHQGVPSNFEQ